MFNALSILATYSTEYSSSYDAGAVAASMIPSIIGSIVGYVLMAIGLMKMFEKAGVTSWYAWIPILNIYWLTKIATGNGWLFLLCLIPCVGSLIWCILTAVKLAPAFGKGGGYIVGLIFIPNIMYLVLGFGDAQYMGPQ